MTEEPVPLGVSAMTIEEKATLCTGASAWTTAPVDRLGLRALTVSDGPHGLRRVTDDQSMAIEAKPATCFPTAACTGSTWDPDLLREMGAAIADEAMAMGVDVVLGPGINMKRSPLCGRNFEYFAEDPYLAGELAVGFIEGVQGRGVGTSLKHFAANNQETRRMSVSADIDERTLREIYLAAFETAVKRARPWTVMCSYNRINGTYASEDRWLLTQILRDEWGFDGVVVSDWSAVHDRVKSLQAGLDLEMPGPRPRRVAAVVNAVRDGAIEESLLDTAAQRLVDLVARAGTRQDAGSIAMDEHHLLARRVAAQGMVLLKNDGTLPLAPGSRVAVIGRQAREPVIQGGGSSRVHPTRLDVPIDELARLAGDAEITYDDGASLNAAAAAARDTDVALVFVAAENETEGGDRTSIDLPSEQVALIKAVTAVQPRTVVVLSCGSVVSMSDWIGDTAAVLVAWLGGQAMGGAVADILFGVVNPCGRLAETVPLRLSDTPAYLNFPGDGDEVRYGEGLFIGYRWYDARALDVQFPFGHGLSYTTFEYGPARFSSPAVRDVDGVTVSVDVTNTGSRSGSEIVQLYVRDPESSLQRPVKELKRFAKVFLEPAETRTVEMRLEWRDFAFFHPGYGRWATEDGEMEVLVGASSRDIRAVTAIQLVSTFEPPTTLSATSTLADWLADGRGRSPVSQLLEDLAPILAVAYGTAAAGEATVDSFPDYLLNMPLANLLEFAAPRGGPDPDVAIEGLLARTI